MSAPNKVHLLVNIPVAGDGFPSEDELSARNAIIDELDLRKFGHFVGAGGGMGAMDFSYVVTDEQQARQTVAEIVKRVLPGKEFTIDVESADDIDLDDQDETPINWPLAIGCLAAIVVAGGLVVWLIWTLVT